MKNKLVKVSTALALGAAAMASQAAVVNLTGWAFGNGNTVNVGAPSHNGSAGGFKGSVDFSAAEEAAGFLDLTSNSFITYCVEINQSFSLPSGNMADYAVMSGATFIRSSDNTVLGTAKADRLGQLFSYVSSIATLVDTAAESTALQLAVWNIVYDTDNTVTGPGVFSENSAPNFFNTYANILLTGSLNTQNRYDVNFLSKNGSQDFLLLRELPEPSSLVLAFAALGGMGAVVRRRKV